MRYQEPSLADALERMKKRCVEQLVIFPLFPQYASATTGSVHQRVMELIKDWQVIPQLSFVSAYPDHPAMIDALREIGWSYNPHSFDHVLLSFHGLPEGQLRKADPESKCLASTKCCDERRPANAYCYRAHCFRTARALMAALDIPEKKASICFQSRLGKQPWLQPYASDVLERLGKQGAERVLVFCPSFVCDCIETTHEIGVEYQELFREAGGGELTLVQGLNSHPSWVKGLKEIILDYCPSRPDPVLSPQEELTESPAMRD
jgi:ferrochelatase